MIWGGSINHLTVGPGRWIDSGSPGSPATPKNYTYLKAAQLKTFWILLGNPLTARKRFVAADRAFLALTLDRGAAPLVSTL